MFKKIFNYVIAPVLAFLGFMQAASAALPAGIQGAIDTATADGSELGYSLLGMAVVVGVIFWLKRKA